MRSSHPESSSDDAVARVTAAIAELRSRLDDAQSTDVETLTWVVESATELSKRLTDTVLPVTHHAALRSELDEVMTRIHDLTGRLIQARDEVGEALAAVRRRRQVTVSERVPSRLDLRS